MSVSVNPPKTPITAGSKAIAAASIPNVCKMPGPPAPFVPTPLPNIGKSDNSPSGYSTSVTIGGDAVAIQGATFNSMGDVASQGTGGGIVSNNVQGPTSFIAPGSLNTKIEGKNVQLLGDQMLNNGGPSGSPANAATMMGAVQAPGPVGGANPLDIKCKGAPHTPGSKKLDPCQIEEICNKCDDINDQAAAGKLKRRTPADQAASRARGNSAAASYRTAASNALAGGATPASMKPNFTADCQHDKWAGKQPPPPDPGFREPEMLSPDHVHEIQVGGDPVSPSNLRWMSSKANSWIGGAMKQYQGSESPTPHTGVKPDCCD
jgi:uncharacterized Zn-binding protein involved in type VI secretion